MPAERRAALDRIEDGRHAVLLLEDNEHELHCDAALIPADVREGDTVAVTTNDDGQVTAITGDRDANDRRHADLRRRQQRLLRDRSSGRFDR